MKISSKQYAVSLYEAAKDLKPAELKAALHNFILILKKNNDLARANSVVLEFGKIWNEREQVVQAEAISVNKLDQEMIKLLEKEVIKMTGAKDAELTNSIDKTILGGIILKIGDEIIDGSLRTKIKELKKEISK